MSRTPRVLIEEWLPVDQIGAECMRENSTGNHPPPNRLHIWWARRPLTISRAAVLGSLLPAWSADWPADLQAQFPTREAYHRWFLKFLGILGDPAKTRQALIEAKKRKLNLGPDPYGYKRAFTVNPGAKELELFRRLVKLAWGTESVSMLDPMAGGGSIPFEALRFGLDVHANDLNPVASIVQKATLEYPARFGPDLARHIESYGERWCQKVGARLERFFPLPQGEKVHAYIWARTVKCPATGKPIPLSPNWWLLKGADPVALKLIADPREPQCRFEVIYGRAACAEFDPEQGTVKRGDARSPWGNREFVSGDYIKAEAQAGRMGQQLMVVGLKVKGGFQFRAPNAADLAAIAAAEEELERQRPRWEADDFIPNELIPFGHRTQRDAFDKYGITEWQHFFSPRQMLSHCTALEQLRAVQQEVQRELPAEQAEAVCVYLALAFDKALTYNSRQCRWDPVNRKVTNTFERHDFSFRWAFAEFDSFENLFLWVLSQLLDSYLGMAEVAPKSLTLSIDSGSAACIQKDTGSFFLVCTDPPYYDNVIYSELSDFFYVWMKRSVGSILPQYFSNSLVNKDDEAVANPARFHGQKKSKELADADYERKMAGSFREMHRVLRDNAVLTVMFTNKRVRAWDALAMGLIEAGFVIETSWPIHTESDHSLHVARKNAAKSTILLVCRKRDKVQQETWWDPAFQARIRQIVTAKVEAFESLGMNGVDLYLSTFGPVLEVVSSAWPVLDPQGGEPIRPERALDLARQAVSDYRIRKMSRNYTVELDPLTRWYVLAWDLFKAADFPFDQGRKLALAVSGEVVSTGKGAPKDFLDGVIKGSALVATKKGDYLHLEDPVARHRKGKVQTEATQFATLLDAFHAAIVLYDEDGLRAVERMLERTGLSRDRNFLGTFELLQRVIPAVRPEFKTLEAIRAGLLRDKVAAPEQQVEELDPDLFSQADTDEDAEEEGEGED